MLSLRAARFPEPSISVPLRISKVFFAVALMMSSLFPALLEFRGRRRPAAHGLDV
jgi:hypothetical protein